MTQKTFLWHQVDGALRRVDASAPLWLANGEGPFGPSGAPRDGAVMITAIAPLRQAVAAALVPDDAARNVVCDGIPLPAGLHALSHGARLGAHGTTFWISSESSHEETDYDVERHGPDVFCFITKARLHQGDAVTVCPGTPAKSCGVIYKQAAWDMALSSPRTFRCPGCGYEPKRATWRPPAEKPRHTLDDLMAIVARQAVARRSEPSNAELTHDEAS